VRLLFKPLLRRFYPSVQGETAQAALFAQTCKPSFFHWLVVETHGFARPDYWADAPYSLGTLPVISLEAQYPRQVVPGIFTLYWQQFLVGWRALQSDLAALSTQTRRIAVNANHELMYEQPEVIIQAVIDLLADDHCGTALAQE
jgi:hypothetical protein